MLLKKTQLGGEYFVVIVSVKREREICTSTNTSDEHELERPVRGCHED